MKYKSPNPFLLNRLEFESGPVLFVSPEIEKRASLRPIIFVGVRGSGKSSVLRLLTWDVAWKVSRITVVGSPDTLRFFDNPRHVGVYYRAEDMDVPLWNRWQVSNDRKQLFFGTYLEFLYLDLIFEAMLEIREISKKFFTESKLEKELTALMLKVCFPGDNKPQLLNLSFRALRENFANIHRGIRHLMLQNLSEDKALQTYPVVAPGYLIREFGNIFQKIYSHDWTFLVLIDDCHFFDKWQTEVINTAVANSKRPISYKLSSLSGMYPTLTTIDKNKPVVLDNLEEVFLPAESLKSQKALSKYEKFVVEVCKARISKYFDEAYAQKFNFSEILGPFNLEALLEKKLKSSERDDASLLLRDAEEEIRDGETPSITKTWLYQKQVREYEVSKGTTDEEIKRKTRQVASKYTKKWNHVAAVAICKEFGLDFPYAGARTVLHLSQGSIREMLRIMAEMWDESGRDINVFLKQKPIPLKIQTDGIYQAAKKRLMLIDANAIVPSGVTLKIICERLGKLFSECQRYPYIKITPEIASIKIDKKFFDDSIEDVIRKGVVSGWLLRKDDQKKLKIGLHPILAPNFGMSFRQPFYYYITIPNKDLLTQFLFGSDWEAEKVKEILLSTRLAKGGRPRTRYRQERTLRNLGLFREIGE